MNRKWIAWGWIAGGACSSPQQRETPKKKVVSISLSATKVARDARLYLKVSNLAKEVASYLRTHCSFRSLLSKLRQSI